jgi:ketosteroid isomerase-like protein
MDDRISDEDLRDFMRRAEEAADAYARGDTESYLALVRFARGFTLLPPFGGPATESENRAETVRGAAGFVAGGAATLEHVRAHAWGDTVVLAMIERQHGQVGGLPDQDLSLRVTQVYRRDGSEWELVHRHADPLVRPVELDELAALLRR